MERIPWRDRPGNEDFEIPLERTGATWRFWVAGWIGGLLLLGSLVGGDRSRDHVDEWPGIVFWVIFLPLVVALVVSGIGIRRGWEPTVLFRLLPLIVPFAMIVLAFALGG
jgi:hypothetical protein